MPTDSLFQSANTLALIGWIVLALSPLSPRWSDRISGLAIPLVLSAGYAALILAFWSRAPGGFDSLPNVMQLFTFPEIALAGWVHYLAFDLLIGAWIARMARAEGIHHLLVLPLLALTFLFGPAGYLAFTLLRASRNLRAPLMTEPRT
ncbi:MAG: ABA4-like family protein [Cereibacter sp.]